MARSFPPLPSLWPARPTMIVPVQKSAAVRSTLLNFASSSHQYHFYERVPSFPFFPTSSHINTRPQTNTPPHQPWVLPLTKANIIPNALRWAVLAATIDCPAGMGFQPPTRSAMVDARTNADLWPNLQDGLGRSRLDWHRSWGAGVKGRV